MSSMRNLHLAELFGEKEYSEEVFNDSGVEVQDEYTGESLAKTIKR